MPLNIEDPRVRKTRKGLQDAFIRLIMRLGYDHISIQDIATEADAARITFYRHYRDKEELLTDCLNHLYEELAEKTEHISAAGLAEGYSPIRVLYNHIEEQADLYRILFSSRGSQTVIERMRHHMATHALRAIENSGKSPIYTIPLDLIAYHAASAQLGLAIWWLDNNKPYSVSYMAQVSLWLTLNGLFTTMGVEGVPMPVPLLE